MKNAEYERVLKFDLSSVVRNIAGPSNPHNRVPTSELAARGISGKVENCIDAFANCHEPIQIRKFTLNDLSPRFDYSDLFFIAANHESQIV